MEHVLWTEKHSPKNADEIAGCGKTVAEVREWLGSWNKGKALLLHGPTGTGKGLIAELIAREMGFLLFKLDASDQRKSADLEPLLSRSKNTALFHKGRIILIDEIDGISSRDRGAIGMITKLIKSSSYPVVLIANDPWKPKLRPLRSCCRFIKFTRVPVPSIAKRLAEICMQEGIKISAKGDVLKSLARWSQGDMRSAVTDLQIISHGKKEITEKDLEALGYRERQTSAYNIMPTIFHSGSISAARKAIYSTDTDPDVIFWWVETNLPNELDSASTDRAVRAYDILSKADMLRRAVSFSQNWRLKGFMVDLLSGLSLFTSRDKHGFVAYKPPQRIIELGRTKAKRALLKSACKKIGQATHTSQRRAKRDILPYLKVMLCSKEERTEEITEHLNLTEEETDILVNK